MMEGRWKETHGPFKIGRMKDQHWKATSKCGVQSLAPPEKRHSRTVLVILELMPEKKPES